MSVILDARFPAPVCEECGFTTRDIGLMNGHSCDVQGFGGRCEDYPACGHESGDCQGLLYGSDAAIREQVEQDWATGHGYCDHPEGIYQCQDDGW